MNCPYCNAYNNPESQFCMNCGRQLTHQAAPGIPQAAPALPSPSSWIGILALRLLLTLFGLWLLKDILIKLSFVRDLQIPEVPISAPEIISVLFFIVMIVLLLNFARTLTVLWPQAFPRYREAPLIINAILYLLVLNFAYKALRPVIFWITTDSEVMMILQIILVILAILIIVYPCIILYQALPGWLSNWRQTFAAPRQEQ